MFCKKCGRRIQDTDSKCPECNAEIPEMEYCSGFWMELNQNLGHADRAKDLQQDTNSPVMPEAKIPIQKVANVDYEKRINNREDATLETGNTRLNISETIQKKEGAFKKNTEINGSLSETKKGGMKEKASNHSNTKRDSEPSFQMTEKTSHSILLPSIILIVGEAAVILVLLIALFGSGVRVRKQINKLNAEIDMLQGKISSLEAEKGNASQNEGGADQNREEYSVPGHMGDIWYENNFSEEKNTQEIDQGQPLWETGAEDQTGRDSSMNGSLTHYEQKPADKNANK